MTLTQADLYAWHVLAYAGDSLAGCVRVYPLAGNGLPSLTETLLGEEQFLQTLRRLVCRRNNTIEIGRWAVDPALRARNGLCSGYRHTTLPRVPERSLFRAHEPVGGCKRNRNLFRRGSRDNQCI